MLSSSGVRVLVVDDEPCIRESLSEFLSDYDYVVSSTESAEEALELLASAPQDVAIVDIRLPGMSGEAFMEQAHSVSPSIRFLVHTGSVHYMVSDELEKVGVRPEHVFLKPLSDLSVIAKQIEVLYRERGGQE